MARYLKCPDLDSFILMKLLTFQRDKMKQRYLKCFKNKFLNGQLFGVLMDGLKVDATIILKDQSSATRDKGLQISENA